MDNISRKDFFKEVFGFFREEVERGKSGMPQKLSAFVPPPGIASLEHYLQSCTKCFECVSACPPMALQVCRDRASEFYDYPVIEPARQACLDCEGYPCIEACPTPALVKENLKTVTVKAVIVENFCLAWQNHFCLSCINACPPEYEAITLNGEGLPIIDETKCTGCGLCAGACPAPRRAIEFSIE